MLVKDNNSQPLSKTSSFIVAPKDEQFADARGRLLLPVSEGTDEGNKLQIKKRGHNQEL